MDDEIDHGGELVRASRAGVPRRVIGALGLGVSAPIVDVGAGASSLVDCLLAEGFPI